MDAPVDKKFFLDKPVIIRVPKSSKGDFDMMMSELKTDDPVLVIDKGLGLLKKLISEKTGTPKIRKNFLEKIETLNIKGQAQKTRNWIASLLIIPYVIFIITALIKGIILSNSVDDLIKFTSLLAGIISAPVGAIIGFYYRSKLEN